MPKTSFLITGLCAAAAIGFALDRWALARQMKNLQRSQRVVAAEPASAARAAPAPDLASLLARAARSEPAVTAAPAEPGGKPEPEPEREIAPGGDDVAPDTRDQMAYVDSLFSGEPVDPGWARGAERSIDGALRERLGESKVESLECRESLCKVRIAHGDEQGFQGFIQRAFGPPAYWMGAIASLRDPAPARDGTIRNTVYFTKDGMDMPILQ